jgi:2-polyprenyl-3-methyl-5-hydroxy-6-metoxy-1,4-benzoquinol methylase
VRPRVLDWVVCPVCGGELELGEHVAGVPRPSDEASPPSQCIVCRSPEPDRRSDGDAGNCDACYGTEIESGVVVCPEGHAYPIVGGVPRLLADQQLESADARSIRESFSSQWDHYDYGAEDKTWGQTIEKRLDDFLRMVDSTPEELEGKLVLDAGCGNGVLSRAVNGFGCEVLAADISDSVEGAHAHFAREGNARTHFVQADLMRPPFRPGAFDIVFCAGVLIVTPSSRETFDRVVEALAPGGTIFVWLYWRESGAKYKFKTLLRRVTSPAPLWVRKATAYAFVPQAMLRQAIRVRRGKESAADALKWREHFVVQHDFFTPRYRWEHTPEEVFEWYRELGFTDIKMTEVVAAGFGVAARRPLAAGSDSMQPERLAASV